MSLVMAAEQSLEGGTYRIGDETDEFFSSTDMSEVYSIKRKSFNVRIRAKIAPECGLTGEATANGIRICISPRKMQRFSSKETSEAESGGISVKTNFRETIMRELSQSNSTKKVLHYLESLSAAKKRGSMESPGKW